MTTPSAARIGTSSGLRAANRASVLRAVIRAGEVSRAELAASCGLSSATVANVVAELVADGLVEERARVPSRGGRPTVLLGVRPGSGYLLGAAVADDEVTVELVDLALRRVDDARVTLSSDPSPVEVAAALRRGVRTVRARTLAAGEPLLGLGLALPGELLGDGLQQTLGHLLGETGGAGEPGEGADVAVRASGHAAALATAEAWRGVIGDEGRTVVAALGRDVDLAVVADGRLDLGLPGGAAWGHTTVVPNGRRCTCSRRGCLTAYLGAGALVEGWRSRGGAAPTTGPDAVAALLAAADGGEAAAVTGLDMALDLLAIALGTAVTLTGARAVVLGGPVGDLLVQARGAALARRVREAAPVPGAEVLSLTGGGVRGAGAFGAALLVLDRAVDPAGLARAPWRPAS